MRFLSKLLICIDFAAHALVAAARRGDHAIERFRAAFVEAGMTVSQLPSRQENLRDDVFVAAQPAAEILMFTARLNA